jgi:hypothetical protein
MKSHSKGGTTAMSAGALNRTEFAQRADTNCRELGEFASKLGNPKTAAGIEQQMDRLLPELWRKIVAQGKLQAPPDEQATAGQWMDAMAAYGRDQEALRTAASRRDAKAIGRANASAAIDATESARLSKELGMRVCFQ